LRMFRAKVISPFVRQQLRPLVAHVSTTDLNDLCSLYQRGQLVPVIDRTFSLNNAPDAVKYVEAGHTRGKVVVVNWGVQRHNTSSIRNTSGIEGAAVASTSHSRFWHSSPGQRKGAGDVAVIELHGLTKCFGDDVAVDDLSFEVDSGQVVGFLGLDGAVSGTWRGITLSTRY
jgi:Zinc-binding dehydrogenase